MVGRLTTSGGSELVLSGTLRNRRFRGEVAIAFSTCSGTRKLEVMQACGIKVTRNPSEMGKLLKALL